MTKRLTKKGSYFFNQKEWLYYENELLGPVRIKPGAPRAVNESYKDDIFEYEIYPEFDYYEDQDELVYQISNCNIDYVKNKIFDEYNLNNQYTSDVNDNTMMIWCEFGTEEKYINEEAYWIWVNDIEDLKRVYSNLILYIFKKYDEYNKEIIIKLNDIENEKDLKEYTKKILKIIDELNASTPYAYLKLYLFDTPYQAKCLLDKHLCHLGIPFDFFKEYKKELFMLDNELHTPINNGNRIIME